MAGIPPGAHVVAAHDLLRGQVAVKQGCPGRVVGISAYFSSIYTVEFVPPDSSDRRVTVNRLSGADLRAV